MLVRPTAGVVPEISQNLVGSSTAVTLNRETIFVPLRATVTLTLRSDAVVALIVGASGAAELPRCARNAGEVEVKDAPTRPFDAIATPVVLSSVAVFALALNTASATPVDEYR